MLLPHELSDRHFGVVQSSEISKLTELWCQNLDWVTPVYEPRGDRYVRSGFRVVNQSDLFTDDEVRRSRFHQVIAKPAGLLHWACGIFSAEGRYWCMPISRGTEPFSPDELVPLAEVAQRMARIVSFSIKICRSNAQNEINTLERVGCAAVLIDCHGRVRQINRHVDELLCSDFSVRHSKLWASGSGNLARLDHFMHEIEHSKRCGGPLPQPVILAREGSPWLFIQALPLTGRSMEIFDGCRSILLITDLTRPQFNGAAVLGMIYGLTNAEARLAAALCEGHDIATVAAMFEVSDQTLRGQLKTIFAKTGSRRQAELVARLANLGNLARH
jgi:DNA-binding CsgD family transcriptional regulator